ncbi:MAG: ATP-binding cassette domain-containing protein [Streptosporangiales bacterium]|nr:ATP-binding cassette domain-containing protein [Streptosporangiales bacterium]
MAETPGRTLQEATEEGTGQGGQDRKIQVDNLTKQFRTKEGPLTALDRLSFGVEKGKFFMVVGPSGCGKSTLLRLLAGLEEPSSGSIRVAPGPPGKPANSMVFQQESIFPWMNVWDNAAYGLRMRGVPKREIREVVGEYLEKTGLTRFARAYPHQLSGGMKQRVALARAFANDPDIMLMDEPFSSLDEQNKTLLQEELLRIWDESAKTVLFITHSVDEAVTLGDQILLMTANPGRIKALIDVPFERPRSVMELRARPEYGSLVYQIWESLREEVEQARQKEVPR